MKKRVVLDFPSGIVEKPITYHLIKKYDIVINILQARIFPEEEGRLIIELENSHEQKINQGLEFLKNEGIQVQVLEQSIIFDRESCMDCGACTGVCKPGALTMDRQTWQLQVEGDKCVLCEMCLSVCPVNALELESR